MHQHFHSWCIKVGETCERDVIGVDDINRNCDSELDLQHPAVKSVYHAEYSSLPVSRQRILISARAQKRINGLKQILLTLMFLRFSNLARCFVKIILCHIIPAQHGETLIMA